MPSGLTIFRSLNARLGDSKALPTLVLANFSLVAALVCVGVGWDLAAGIALLISAITEYPLEKRTQTLAQLFDQASFGIPMRFLIRALIAVMAIDVLDDRLARLALALGAAAVLVVLCVRALHQEYRRIGPLKPMQTRNIPGNPHINDEPAQHFGLIVIVQVVTLGVPFTGAPWWVILAAAVAMATILMFATLPSLRRSWALRSAKRKTGFTGPLRHVQDFIDTEQPEVIVHLSGPAEAAYQINTWLEALEALPRTCLIVIRDLPLFENIVSTRLPILGLPAASEVLMLDFSCAKVSLFPSNTGNNIHLLRLPGMMSAFIGHGDSDKSASNNPFSRAYDELWVAGEAGADRYRNSGLGIDESRYRFVGRPQVDGIVREPFVGAVDIPTVLYAPTWEGVNPEQEYSSLRAIGRKLIEELLNNGNVRVVYKPHPFTGQRDPRYRADHAQIVSLLSDAKVRTGINHQTVRSGPIGPWFNEATGLITDISSVVSDFLASEKPYAVFDHEVLGVKRFREEYPSSAAATILSSNGEGIEEFLNIVTGSTPDHLAQYRSKLSTYLLGPAEKRTVASFIESIEALIERSERERAAYRQ